MKFIPISLLLIAVCASAQEVMVALDKDSALQACEEKAQNSPESTRSEMLSSCRCVVGQTDFEQIAAHSEAGNDDALKALYEEAGQACQATEASEQPEVVAQPEAEQFEQPEQSEEPK